MTLWIPRAADPAAIQMQMGIKKGLYYYNPPGSPTVD